MGFGNYDAWKLRSPDDDRADESTCPHCGEYMVFWKGEWGCADCEIHDEQLQRQADDEATPATLEDLEDLAAEEADGRTQ